VAHGVNFDFNFINSEFERIKHKKLNNETLDTLTLAQIIYPSLEKHNLAFLSEELEITLYKNHLANLDALATAELLIKIKKKIADFPIQTTNEIRNLNFNLIGNTKDIFSIVEPNNKKHNLKDLGSNVLRRKKIGPKNIKNIKKIKFDEIGLSTDFNLLDRQLKLADVLLYSRNDLTMIETRTRFGKTNTMLYYAFQRAIEDKKTLIVAKDKRNLSHIKKRWNELFSQYVNLNIFTSVPSKNEFIDIDSFKKTLEEVDTNNLQIAKVKILIWLLETRTGFLDELSSYDLIDITDKIKITNFENENIYYENYFETYTPSLIGYTTVGDFEETNKKDFKTVIFSGDIDEELIRKTANDVRTIAIKKATKFVGRPYTITSVL
jgi:ATP-dependent DNA helicase DinG